MPSLARLLISLERDLERDGEGGREEVEAVEALPREIERREGRGVADMIVSISGEEERGGNEGFLI